MKTLQVIIEKADDGFYGRIEGHKSYLPVTFGKSENDVIRNLKALIKDYQTHEKNGDNFWLELDEKNLEFDFNFLE